MTYIEEYYNKIVTGEIVACKRIKQVYKKLVDDLYNPKDNWVFDLELANRPIEFIETFCYQSQGTLGKPLKLELFQKAKFQAVFGFVDKDTRLRKYKEVLTIEGRKNGKTTELAGVNNFMLVGDGEGPFIFCINLILFLLYFLFIFLSKKNELIFSTHPFLIYL